MRRRQAEEAMVGGDPVCRPSLRFWDSTELALRPNYGLKLTSRLAALARDQLGSVSYPYGQRDQGAGSQLNPVR